MTTTEKKSRDPYATTFHRNGTVTLWHTGCQQWIRIPVAEIGDDTMATLSHAERARIERMRAKEVR